MHTIWWHFVNFVGKLRRMKPNDPAEKYPLEDQCVAMTRDGKIYVGRAFINEDTTALAEKLKGL